MKLWQIDLIRLHTKWPWEDKKVSWLSRMPEVIGKSHLTKTVSCFSHMYPHFHELKNGLIEGFILEFRWSSNEIDNPNGNRESIRTPDSKLGQLYKLKLCFHLNKFVLWIQVVEVSFWPNGCRRQTIKIILLEHIHCWWK